MKGMGKRMSVLKYLRGKVITGIPENGAILSLNAGISIFRAICLAWLSLFLFVNPANSENVSEVYRVYSMSDHDIWGNSIIMGGQEKYFIVGGAKNKLTKKESGLIIKTDRNGNTLYIKKIGEESTNASFSKGKQTDSSTLILSGYANMVPKPVFQAGSFAAADGWAVSITTKGGVRWTKALEFVETASYEDIAISIKPPVYMRDVYFDQNKELTLIGCLRHGVFDEPIIWKLSPNGQHLWHKVIGTAFGTGSVIPSRIRAFQKSSFLVTGIFIDYKIAGGETFGWICVLDKLGNIIWEKKLSKSSECPSVVELSNGYIRAITLQINKNNQGKLHITDLTSDGSIVRDKVVDLAGLCRIHGLWNVETTRFIIGGSTCNSEKERIWIIEVTENGKIESIRKYLTKKEAEVREVLIENDGHIIAAGTIKETDNLKAWFYKTRLHEKIIDQGG